MATGLKDSKDRVGCKMEEARAKSILRRAFGSGRSALTPTVLEVGLIRQDTAFELSTGKVSDPDFEEIYIVRVASWPDRSVDDRVGSRAFQHRHAAAAYIDYLKKRMGQPDGI